MLRLIFFIQLVLNVYADDSSKIRLKLGETYLSQQYPVKIVLKKFHTTKTECAVPGFNCGSGYTPSPVTTAVVDFIQTNPDCRKSPRPKECEKTFKIVGTDNKTYVDIEIINIYDFCMSESNKDNRNSCILRTTVGNHFNPMYSPENCNRADDTEVKNNCFEMMAENLKDVSLCKQVSAPYGRRCVLLMAITAAYPEICQQIMKSPLNPSELNERQLYINQCLESVKQLKRKK